MGFGYKYKDFPTPESVVFRTKLIVKIIAGVATIIQPIEFNHVVKEIITGVLATSMGVLVEIQDYFGHKITGKTVPTKDVEVIKDEAIKMLIFLVLVNTYLYLF